MIPPFRDSLQTGYFLAAQKSINPNTDNDITSKLYEIGKTKAFDLDELEVKKTFKPNVDPQKFKYIKYIFIAIFCSILFYLAYKKEVFLAVYLFFYPTGLYMLAITENGKQLLHFLIGVTFILNMGLCFSDTIFLFIKSKLPKPTPKIYKLLSIILVTAFFTFIFSLVALVISSIFLLLVDTKESEQLVEQLILEPFSWHEGISIWPTELIRNYTFILAFIFIYRLKQFPIAFTKDFLEDNNHFNLRKLPKLSNINTKLNQFQRWFPFNSGNLENEVTLTGNNIIENWLIWNNSKWLRVSLFSLGFIGVNFLMFYFFGESIVPARGDFVFIIDFIILHVLLIPAFTFLMVMAIDNAEITILLIKQISKPNRRTLWPDPAILAYSKKFGIPANHIHEWVGLRFIGELTDNIDSQLSYTLLVGLFFLTSRSNYFDNWVMPTHLTIFVVLVFAYILSCDYRLKLASDNAVKDATQYMQRQVIAYNGTATAEQLEQVIKMVNNSDKGAFKPFTKRPIFIVIILIAIAFLFNITDIWQILLKLFNKG